jgi:hypothetical protein
MRTRDRGGTAMRGLRMRWVKALVLSVFSTQPLPFNMHFCGFCGKGPFPSTSGLKRHIVHSVNCNKAERQVFERSAADLWKNTPDPEHHPPEPPQILEDEELFNIPDITLEDDLLVLEEELANNTGPPDTPPTPSDQRGPLRAVVQDTEIQAKENESAFYIEECPADLGAGAVWGEEVPYFEKVLREQKENGSSRWGPFEDEDEWELAKWLIRNVGHNQTDTFLNLNIVGFVLRVSNDH